MYTVVLVDKEDHEVIGDIGTYTKFNEAEYQANDYNRKGDRHRGHAIIQAKLGQPIEKPKPMGLKLGSGRPRPNPIMSDERPRMGIPKPRPVMTQQRSFRTVVEDVSDDYDDVSSEDEIVEQIAPQANVEPTWHQSHTPHDKSFSLLVDQRNGHAIVLENNRFLPNFLLANPNYVEQSKGAIHDMIKQRNQLMKSRKR
jgi:hypothetical protein